MKNKKRILLILITVILFVCCIISLFVMALPRVQIQGKSMAPEFQEGDLWIVNNVSYSIKRGDVVVYESRGTRLFHRAIALPGETIRIEDCLVYINQEVVKEDYLQADTCTQAGAVIREGIGYTLEEDQYLLLGDNRDASFDSRSTGFVNKENIVGEMWFKL